MLRTVLITIFVFMIIMETHNTLCHIKLKTLDWKMENIKIRKYQKNKLYTSPGLSTTKKKKNDKIIFM